MASDATAKQSSITVSVRVRPFTEDEEKRLVVMEDAPLFASDGQLLQPGSSSPKSITVRSSSLRKIVNVVDDKMLIFDPPDTSPLVSMQRKLFPNPRLRTKIRDCRFVFDRLFDDDATQQQVYENTTKPLLDSIIDGYNATVFAYGATGCGKTHTILGTPQDPGVIFLTLKELYERIDRLSDERKFDVSVSFLEIYNETIRDLLSPDTPSKTLNLREDSKNKITVSNLLTHTPTDIEEIKQLIVVGNRNRTSSPTEANSASSRSHAVLQINVALTHRTASLREEHLFATLSIIDLAGSERAANTKNRGATLHEGANINKSLLALGNCINSLCDPRRKNHVPYRDLKLTRLLKFSLGGNCKTVMIVCISPLSQHYDETFNTLKYADRVKQIKTKVIRNRQNLDRHVGSYLKMITEQKQEIDELRSREAQKIEATKQRSSLETRACLDAILQQIESLKMIVDKHVSEKWKKYYVLAKRKLLLLDLNNLETIHTVLNQHSRPIADGALSSIRTCLLQIELLRAKFNEQIVHLERLYDSSSEIEDALHKSKEHTHVRLQELEGWNESYDSIFNVMFGAVEDYLQNDLLLNSSILFDFLVGKLNKFNFLQHVFCQISEIQLTACDYSKELDKIFHQVTLVLELMNNSEYDVTIEKIVSSFMTTKFKSSNDEMLEVNEGKALTNVKAHDKRASSSPLKNSPACKRTIRPMLEKMNYSNITLDMDLSSDLSTLNKEDDSPITDRIDRSFIEVGDLSFEPALESPPLSHVHDSLDFKKPKLLSSDKLMKTDFFSRENHYTRIPLLNKEASNKILAKSPDSPSKISSSPKFDLSVLDMPSDM
ncbi:hypothetical protein PUMCH_000197 [Australozyma saopauloensis]|uniref:Kinesin-like protein n=1 Tax=Australozyma saopauloensis TaxID=291208 RepID=A0AAX4H461_9ASCO|nr:hypothetical protein PUMCH_000197 [[Candida] saopauloensis]